MKSARSLITRFAVAVIAVLFALGCGGAQQRGPNGVSSGWASFEPLSTLERSEPEPAPQDDAKAPPQRGSDARPSGHVPKKSAPRIRDCGASAAMLDALDNAVRRNPKNRDVLYHRGLWHFQRRDYEHAAADFDRVLQLAKDRPALPKGSVDRVRTIFQFASQRAVLDRNWARYLRAIGSLPHPLWAGEPYTSFASHRALFPSCGSMPASESEGASVLAASPVGGAVAAPVPPPVDRPEKPATAAGQAGPSFRRTFSCSVVGGSTTPSTVMNVAGIASCLGFLWLARSRKRRRPVAPCVPAAAAGSRPVPRCLGYSLLGLSLAATIAVPGHAQCRPGDLLLWSENLPDATVDHCLEQATSTEVRDLQARYEPGLLGNDWRMRKAIIDGAACLHKRGVLYGYGRKMAVPPECSPSGKVEEIDCSGLSQAAVEFAACATQGLARILGQFDPFGPEPRSADEQARILQRRGALLPANGHALPGDVVFFSGTHPGRKGITHVGVFLGKNAEGTPYLIHASSVAGKVAIGPMGTYLQAHLAGYGSLSAYYHAVTHQ